MLYSSYGNIWDLEISSGFDTNFRGLEAHNFLLSVTSFAYYSLEMDMIYSSPEVKHVHVGLGQAREDLLNNLSLEAELEADRI